MGSVAFGGVTRVYVPKFVRENPCHFRFITRKRQEATSDVHISPWQRECIDNGGIQKGEAVRIFIFRVRG